MAITHNGTVNSLKASQLPTGYTVPTVTTFTDYQYVRDITLDVLKATVDEAGAAATMTAIFDNVTIGLDKQIEDELALDFLGSATVTAYADLTAMRTNFTYLAGTDEYLTTAASKYICTVKLYVKVA